MNFQQLKKIWYQKLADSGFEDIEYYEDSSYGLNNPLEKQKLTPDQWQAKQDYYVLATRFLEEFEFECERDKVIWNYHTEGISIRNIAKLLFDTGLAKSNNKSTVGASVKRLENKMKSLYLKKD